MTVKELIAELSQCDLDAEVHVMASISLAGKPMYIGGAVSHTQYIRPEDFKKTAPDVDPVNEMIIIYAKPSS
jgi:hypothetical protein